MYALQRLRRGVSKRRAGANPVDGEPPVVLHPGECDCSYSTMSQTWLGLCIIDCPRWAEGAISRYDPWYMRPRVKRGTSGEEKVD